MHERHLCDSWDTRQHYRLSEKGVCICHYMSGLTDRVSVMRRRRADRRTPQKRQNEWMWSSRLRARKEQTWERPKLKTWSWCLRVWTNYVYSYCHWAAHCHEAGYRLLSFTFFHVPVHILINKGSGTGRHSGANFSIMVANSRYHGSSSASMENLRTVDCSLLCTPDNSFAYCLSFVLRLVP